MIGLGRMYAARALMMRGCRGWSSTSRSSSSINSNSSSLYTGATGKTAAGREGDGHEDGPSSASDRLRASASCASARDETDIAGKLPPDAAPV